MQIPKPTDADRERFTKLVPDAPGVEIKPMFGNLGGLMNGNMFMGLFGSAVGIKLPDEEREKLLARAWLGPVRSGRPTHGRRRHPPGCWTARKAAPWIDKALTHAASLPPKAPKKRRSAP